MNRNGYLKKILEKMYDPGYNLEDAKADLKYVIDYVRGLEDEFREAEEDRRWSNR